MRGLHVFSAALTGAGLIGCSGRDASEPSAEDAGASDCSVAYSCRAEMHEGTFTCVESSERPSEAEDACHGASIAGLSYVFSESPCPRVASSSGCLVRDGTACRVSWFYGTVPGNTFAQQCSSQGHEPVSR